MEPTGRTNRARYDRTVSLGNILTVVSMLAGLVTMYSQFKSEMATMQVTILTQQREADRQREQLQQLRQEVRDDIREIRSDQRRIADSLERVTAGKGH